MYWLWGYQVNYGDKVLEQLTFRQRYWLKKSEIGLKLYREGLYNFFADTLLEEGESENLISENLMVMLFFKEYYQTKREKVIKLFDDNPNLTIKKIARLTDSSVGFVTETLTEYLQNRRSENRRNERIENSY